MALEDMDPGDEVREPGAEEALDEIVAAYVAAVERGERPERGGWLALHAEYAKELEAFFDDYDRFGRLSQPLPSDVLDPYSLVGTRLGDYEIEAQVARGGMGAVFLARQMSVGRRVALKLVLGGRLASAEERRRFHGEALAAARLEHPGIVRVFEVGEVDGRPYYTMPYVEGGSLAGRIAEYAEDPRRAARLVAKVARAVHFANEAGILHRDVKPSNILLDAHGDPWLADFGLAKETGSSGDLTRTGAVLGTAEYIAPELARGKKAQATRAADIYSLGAVLYEMLAGGPPFRGATPLETLEQARRDEPPPLRRRNPRVARDLETISRKCLEKDPRRRYATAKELADDLERYLGGEPIVARSTPRWERAVKWALRHPTLSIVCLVASLALVAVLILSFGHNVRLRRALDDSRRHVYLSTMRLGYEAARDGRLGEVETMLEATRPAPGEEDLRSFDWYALRRFAGARRWTLAHPAAIERVLFHPTRLVLACAGRDGVVYVWDLEAGTLAARLPASGYPVQALDFSPDGALLAAVGRKESTAAINPLPVTVWNWQAREKVLELPGTTPRDIVGLHFDATGERLVLCGKSQMESWILASGALESRIDAVPALGMPFSAFSGGARELAARSSTRTREWTLYDLKARKRVPAPPLPAERPGTSMALAPDGQWLAHAFEDGQAFLMRAGEESPAVPLDGLRGTAAALAFSHNGELLAAGSRGARGGGELSIHAVPSGKLVARVLAHNDDITGVAFSPQDDLIATCTAEDAKVRVWDREALSMPDRSLGPVRGSVAAISPGGEAMAVAGPGKEVSILDLGSRTVRAAWQASSGVSELAFSPDGGVLACSWGRKVELWSVAKSEKLAELPGHRGQVGRVRYDPSGRLLAVGSLNAVRVWDAASHAEVAGFTPHSNRVHGVVFSTDGQWLLSSGLDGRLVSTRVGTWKSTLVAQLPAPARDLALSPDGATAALACGDGMVRLVDVGSGRVAATLTGHKGAVHGVAFSRDGRVIASAGADTTIRLWDRLLGRERAIVATPEALEGILFGPGDDFLAVVSHSSALWVLRAPKEVAAASTLRAFPELGAGESRWTKVDSSIIARQTDTVGAVWADYDADGDPDVCLLRHGSNRLLRNDGGGLFMDATAGAFAGGAPGTCAAWGDCDGDGDLDLYAGYSGRAGRLLRNQGGVLREVPALELGVEDAGFAAWADLDGDSDLDLVTVGRQHGTKMTRNDGGAFADATPEEIRELKSYRTSTLLDLDGDGDLDLCAGHDQTPAFHINEGSFRFRKGQEPFPWYPRVFRAVAWNDWDGDGDLDCLVSARSRATPAGGPSSYELSLHERVRQGHFREVEGRLIPAGLAKGLAWGDYDQDGRADVFVTRDDGKSMLLRGGDEGLEIDRDGGLPETIGQSPSSASWVDHDGDGDLDLFITDLNGTPSLFQNETKGAHHLKVILDGRAPNRFAVGATVRLLAAGRWQTRVVAALESNDAGHFLPLHFGLGEAATVDRIEVRWPGGRVQVLVDVAADQTLRIEEGESAFVDRTAPVVGLGGAWELDGTAALPSEGGADVAGLRWERVAGPGGDAVADATAVVTKGTFAKAGRYVYHLVSGAAEATEARTRLRLTVPVAPVGIRLHRAPRCPITLLELPYAGDCAFDPRDSGVLFVAVRTSRSRCGGIERYRWTARGPVLEWVIPADFASSILPGPSGDLWYAQDRSPPVHLPLARFPSATGPPFGRGAVVIAAFAGLETARPSALALVPPGFEGPQAAAGDVLIALSRKENDLIPVIGRYMPGAPIADLKAYTVVAETPGLGPEWKGAYLGDIDFAPDGSAVYLLPKGKDHVFELDPAFASSRKLVPAGARLTRLAALAVDPRDGRLWVASDARDELWSLDPRTSEARLEVSFVKEGVEGGSGKAILFPSPSLRFSNDGRRLVVSDAQGWVWVLEWE